MDVIRKEKAYERLKRRTGKYKVNGKDYRGYILCYFVRGTYKDKRRMVIAHTNSIETYLNSRKCVVVEQVVLCKKIESPNRKYIFQLIHEYCDKLFEEETLVVSSKARFEKFLGQDAKHEVIIKRPPSEHTYLVKPDYDVKDMQTCLDQKIATLVH